MSPGWHLSDLFAAVVERSDPISDISGTEEGRPCLNEYLTVHRTQLRNAVARLFTFHFELA